MAKGINRRSINVRITVGGVVNDVPQGVTPYEGLQYIVGDAPTGAFSGATAKQLAEYDGSGWNFSNPKSWYLEVFDESDATIKRYDQATSSWVAVKQLATKADVMSSYTGVHEEHVLTDAEIAAKQFDLANLVADDAEARVWLWWESVFQSYGTDYTVAENTGTNKDAIKWDGLGMEELDLRAGDVIRIQYELDTTDGN